MNRPALITLIQDNRSRFEQVLSKVNPVYLTEPFSGDQRSVKDILVHLTMWEQRLLRWLQEAARNEIPAIPEPGLTWADMDRLNEETLRQNHDRSFDEILSAWIMDEYGNYPLCDMIVAGPGCCHYHDHFYELLVRTDPEKRFVADPLSLDAFSGTYIDNRQRSLIFHVAEDCLFLNVPWRGREIPGLALDERRFVYKDFGLVAFQSAQDDTLLVVEWWNHVFRRTEE